MSNHSLPTSAASAQKEQYNRHHTPDFVTNFFSFRPNERESSTAGRPLSVARLVLIHDE